MNDKPLLRAPSDRGWRGSVDLWLDAAHALLVEGGVEAVKVMPLAARVGLSRTSFYWHFTDREALLTALVDRWRAKNTAALIARTKAPARTVAEATLNVFDCWIDGGLFDSALEFVMRNWALTDVAVAAALTAEDARRTEALTALFLRHGMPPGEAKIRARTVYLTQIGYISQHQVETLADRMESIPAYVLIFTGTRPTEEEVAAFRARHEG